MTNITEQDYFEDDSFDLPFSETTEFIYKEETKYISDTYFNDDDFDV